MKTFPDFTWEWIFKSCETLCNQLQSSGTEDLPERINGYIQNAQGLIAIIPKLREHPQLEKLVPMKSLMTLKWFPAKDWEIDLYCEESEVKYKITILRTGFKTDRVREEKVVAFNDVAEELFTYICKLRDD